MKLELLNKIRIRKPSKKYLALIATISFLGIFLAVPTFASSGWVTNVLGGLLGGIITGIGLILILAIRGLVLVAQYSYFLDSSAVVFGWVIVRDLANMFFVVVLLIIAFGTILNIEKYNYKKWLPKLVLMAILINFSKTICGVLIDIAQVVMLTFVGSFSTIGAGALIDILGITEILQFHNDSEAQFWTVIGAYLLGIAYVIVALIVVVTMIAMLAIRIVMIWIYVVLSPLAYLLMAFPGGQSYASRWWSEFTKNLIVGPVLAFFLWLSFAALSADQFRDYSAENEEVNTAMQGEVSSIISQDAVSAMGTKASTPGALIKFVIAIGMLVGGLKIAQEVGGAAGSMAGKGMAAVNKAGKIGLAGAAAVTGVRKAKGIAKNYVAGRKAKREEGYKEMATKMAGGIGSAKAAVGGFVTGNLQKVRNVTIGRAGAKAKRLEEEARNDREKVDIMEQNVNQKSGIVDTGVKDENDSEGRNIAYEYDKSQKAWKNVNTNQVVDESEVRGSIKTKNESISAKEKEAKELNEKQENRDSAWKSVAIVGGLAAGLTGGLPGLAIAGGAMFGASKGYKRMKQAGSQDLDTASGFKIGEIKKNKEKLKDEDDRTVLAKMDDKDISAFARAAASLEAMERGLLSSEKAKEKKDEIRNATGGANEEGGFKDKKVGSYFESIAQKKNISASKDFEDLNSKDKDVKDRARKNIHEKIESGEYNLDSLDMGAIKAIRGDLAELMKSKAFAKQFADMKDQGKKREIVETMKEEANMDTSRFAKGSIGKNNAEARKVDAMTKLNLVVGLEQAVEGASDPASKQAAKEKVVQNTEYSISQLYEIQQNDDKQFKALQEMVRNYKGNDIDAVFPGLKGSSLTAKTLRNDLGLDAAGGKTYTDGEGI